MIKWWQREHLVHGIRCCVLDLCRPLGYSNLFGLDLNTGLLRVHLWASCWHLLWKGCSFPRLRVGDSVELPLAPGFNLPRTSAAGPLESLSDLLLPLARPSALLWGHLPTPLSHCSSLAHSLAPLRAGAGGWPLRAGAGGWAPFTRQKSQGDCNWLNVCVSQPQISWNPNS